MGGLVFAAALTVVLERLPAVRFRPAPLLRAHFLTDVTHLLVSCVGLGLLGAVGLAHVTSWVGTASVWATVPRVAQVVLALVAIDLGNYVAHWLLHRVDALWALHQVHHSSTHLDWLATFRSHVGEQLLRRSLAPLLLIADGVPADTVAVAATIFFAWAVLNHANVRLPLGALEGVFITPRLHRVHHVPRTSERNFGTVFSCWDRLRGTLVHADPPPDTVFGFPRQPADYPQDWARQLIAPFVRLSARRR